MNEKELLSAYERGEITLRYLKQEARLLEPKTQIELIRMAVCVKQIYKNK